MSATSGRRPSGALEHEILVILWTAGRPLTAIEVQVACESSIAYNTVHTVLTRLQHKGQVRRVGPPGRSAYEPVRDAAESAAEQMRAVLDSGADRSAVLALFASTLTPAEADLLRTVLDADA